MSPTSHPSRLLVLPGETNTVQNRDASLEFVNDGEAVAEYFGSSLRQLFRKRRDVVLENIENAVEGMEFAGYGIEVGARFPNFAHETVDGGDGLCDSGDKCGAPGVDGSERQNKTGLAMVLLWTIPQVLSNCSSGVS